MSLAVIAGVAGLALTVFSRITARKLAVVPSAVFTKLGESLSRPARRSD